MMSLGTIRSLSDEIAREAAARKAEPYVPWDAEEVRGYERFPFPNLGSHCPDEWERAHEYPPTENKYSGADGTDGTWFVDKGGWGSAGEPAMTAAELRASLAAYVEGHPGHGFAIIEEGQFQLYVAAFCRAA